MATIDRPLHAWVPDKEGPELMGELPESIVVSVWDDPDAPPSDADLVRVVALPYVPDPSIAGVLARLPELEMVQALTAGTDLIRSVVPPGIRVAAARGLHAPATSEWVVSLILACLGRFKDSAHRSNYEWGPLRDTLDGKHVLIVGHGEIGAAVERRLAGFDVEITRVARSARPGVHGVDELDELLPSADILVIMAPLTEETRGLISRVRLASLPDGACVVNAARGAILDQQALREELVSGRLLAGLDVADPDPLPPGHELRGLRNLIYSPHIGGWTRDVMPRTYAFIASQLLRVRQGEEPVGLVDP